jgi:lysophospholipase L1-like esterase
MSQELLFKEISIFVFANFATLETSDRTNPIVFTPTFLNGAVGTYIYTVNKVLGRLDTKISLLKYKFTFTNSMLTTNKNVKYTSPKVTIKTAQYNTSFIGKDAQLTVSLTSQAFREMFIIWNDARKSTFKINTRTFSDDVVKVYNLQTMTRTALVASRFSDSMGLKNNNMVSRSPDSIVIGNYNIIQTKRYITNIFFTLAQSSGAYVGYSIWTKILLEYNIYTEIHKIRIVTMGDSITAGHPNYWAENEVNYIPNSGTGNYLSQYQYWLQRRLSDDYEVINSGRGSDTTERMVNRFTKDVIELSPQYCIIQGGTNDITWAVTQNKGNLDYLINTMEKAKQNLILMVNRCFANNIVPIIGTLIPRTSVTGIYKQALWDYNKWIIEYCNGRDGLYYVDFYNAGKDNIPPTPLEESPVTGSLNPLYDGDSVFDVYGNLVRRGYGIHPNIAGLKLMAEAIPLSIFSALKTGVKLYIDEECTVEENTENSDIYHNQYNIAFSNLDRGRTKVIIRYIKNVGNSPMLYTLYNTSESGIDMTFSTDGVNYSEIANGLLNNETINKIYIKVVVPRTGILPTVQSALSARSYKVLT